MSYSVYAIQCSDHSVYIGQTTNLLQRWQAHQAGRIKWTQHRKPLRLVYREVCADRNAVRRREQQLKTGFGRQWLKQVITRSGEGGLPARGNLPRQAGKTVGAGVISAIVA